MVLAAVICCSALPARSAGAQAQAPPGRLEVGAGVRWIDARALGTSDATLTTPGGGRFTLFSTEGRLEPLAALEARLGVRLSQLLQVEAAGSYGRSDLSVRLASDVEGIPNTIATESVTHYTIEGAIVLRLGRWRIGARSAPYLSAGAGYLRQLHENATLLEHGAIYHVGGGVNYLLRTRDTGLVNGIGLRADGRATVRTGGVAFDRAAHTAPSVAVSVFLRF